MPAPRVDPVRGLLNVDFSDGRVRLARYLPSEPVAAFVEHYWIVRWDLPSDEPFTAENLPYPSVHIVLQPGESRIQGVTTGKFAQILQGRGFVFGVKFKPGGFRPLIGASVSTLTNRTVALSPLLAFGPELESAVLDKRDDSPMLAACESVLARHLPQPNPQVALLTEVCDAIAADRAIVRVDQVLPRVGLRKRALERAFREYVGVPPKWVIQRYRLFEAADRLRDPDSNGATVAAELGYFDQAHFIRDFKKIVGVSPIDYRDLFAASHSSVRT
jgi:AraC-like DNA-binding protein